MKQFLLGALSYPIIVFPLAVVWHLVVFQSVYEDIGYIGREEPGFLLGFLSIVTQGVLLSFLYPRFYQGDPPIKSGLKFGALAGLFHWTIHVLAFAAKAKLGSVELFFAIETVYLAVQFLLTSVVLALIYGRIEPVVEAV